MIMETNRVFLAIEVPQEAKANVTKLNEDMTALGLDAKWVKPDNFHVNLRFFGDKTVEEIDNIKDIVNSFVKKQEPFEIKLRGLGVFPNQEHIRVSWIGVFSDKLFSLQNELEDIFEEKGLNRSDKKYSPHLTLGRIKSPKNIELLIQMINKNKDVEFGTFQVKTIFLFESKLTPEGPIYNKLAEFRLGD
jgi:RNA 2',3'-cyclic 3'-phosphodiesterase